MKFNQIKKFIRCFYFLCISFVILFSAASCSLFSTEGSGSVTFRIDGAMAQKITEVSSRSITAARDVISSETEIQEGFYVDIALKGDYTAQKTIPVTEGASAVFEGIPVGAKISATASAYEIFPYEMEIQKIVLYTASSEEIRVKEGKNTIRLKFSEPSSSSLVYIYVTAKNLADSEEDTGDGSEENPFASLSAALNQINEYADSTVNYTIVLSGEFTAMYEMSSSLNGKAASITLTGRTGNTEDILNGAIGGNNSYTLSISTTVPVMITNLKITGGQAGLSLGYDEENSANVEVSVTLGEGCLVTDNGNSSGINLNAGTLILDGASITANCCEYGGGVSVSGGNFIMISGTIGGTTEDDANTSDYRGAGVYISGGTFTMKGGTICGNKTSSGSGAGVYVGFENVGSDDETCGTFIMEGGTISGNESGTAGGGVFVDGYDSDSALTGTVTFTMSGGTITGNTNTSTYDEGERGGGGVALYGEKAEFIMEGGTITANESSCYGGGVSVTGGAKFTMNAGTIGGTSSAEGNKVTLAGYSSYGAGVYVGDSATFTMEGGSISYNSTSSTGSTTGGGAVCAYSGTFIMNGGTLSNNSSAGSGGAVYIGSTGTFEMTGGTVTGNSCGSEGSGKAVYVRTNGSDSGTLTMGGSAVIASGNDVYLPSGAVITITEAFDGDIETVAVITPETYSTDITVLAAGLDDDGNTLVELEYEYDVFAVTPEGTTIYIVSSEGKLIVSE